jgi:hypothetical protein
MRDVVRSALPLGPLAQAGLARAALERICDLGRDAVAARLAPA